jgi:hypothetical protein
MKVWIAQLKCPNNYAVIALAAEVEDQNTGPLEAMVRDGFDQILKDKLVRRECGICKSTTFHVEIGKAIFDSMEDAKPALAESQRQQWASAEFLKRSKN